MITLVEIIALGRGTKGFDMKWLALGLASLITIVIGACIYFAYVSVSLEASPLWQEVGGALGFAGVVLLGITGFGRRRRR